MIKFSSITNIIFAIILPFLILNLIISGCDINNIFSFLFIYIALLQTYVGIKLLNENKKILSSATFLLSIFFFSIVGIKIYLNL